MSIRAQRETNRGERREDANGHERCKKHDGNYLGNYSRDGIVRIASKTTAVRVVSCIPGCSRVAVKFTRLWFHCIYTLQETRDKTKWNKRESTHTGKCKKKRLMRGNINHCIAALASRIRASSTILGLYRVRLPSRLDCAICRA